LLATAAIAAAIALAGCNTDGTSFAGRDLQPLSPQMEAKIEQKNMTKESPILVRIFKQEAELEVWKEDRSGRFALLETYPICRWSGQLGPKIREGDRQAPEGFYTITPAQLNPNSNYYLSFNMGYPNAYDRAWGRTGSQLMVHGDCSSRGCYAVTDQQITEIYALARESFVGGQRSFQVQAYPFRMTPLNMAKHRNNPSMAFWKMIKRGYDHFEVSHLEPKVDVCQKHYVFNAEPPAGSAKPPNFSPAGRCPAYSVPQDIAQAVLEKQRRDEFQIAELIRRGTRTVPINTAVDGGMNQVFLAGLKDKGTMRNGESNVQALAATETPERFPVVAAVSPASEQLQVSTTGSLAIDNVPMPRAAPKPKAGRAPAEQRSFASRIGGVFGLASDDNKRAANSESRRVASNNSSLFGNLFSSNDDAAEKKTKNSNGVFDRMGRMIGLRGPQQETADAAPAPHPAPAARLPRTAAAAAIQPHPPRLPAAPAAAPARAKAPPAEPAKPRPLDQNNAPPVQTASNGARTNAGLVTGAAPVVPSGSFNSRWYGN
jgi:murein L,D-transpeptidase YafK